MTPFSTGRPNRSARSSNALATRPGTSVNTRSARCSLVRRNRCASAARRALATSGRPVTARLSESLPSPMSWRLGDRCRGHRPRPGVEEAQLAEHLAGSEDRDEVLAAVGAGPAELDLPLPDHVERVAALALAEQDVATLHADRAHLRKECVGVLAVQGREERRLEHNLVVHAHSVPERATPPRTYEGTLRPHEPLTGGHLGCSGVRRLHRAARRERAGRVAGGPDPAGPPHIPRAPRALPVRPLRLDFTNPLELLVATILSAQTTDQRVNLVTPHVFARYPDAAAYAGADRTELETMIQSTGFFRNKSDALIKLGRRSSSTSTAVPGPARRPRHAARRRTQDRECGAGQRVRRPRHHRRHPLRAARAPVRVDRGDRPGQGRARDRRDVPAAGLDDAQPRPDLSRPADLSREEAGLRRVPVAAWCPSYGAGPTDRDEAMSLAGLRAEAGRDAPGPASRTAARADRPPRRRRAVSAAKDR